MRCPSCSAELEIADRQGIEIRCCPRCAGIWLNAGILEEIVGRTLDADEELAERPQANGEKPRNVRFSPHFPVRGVLKMKLICVGALAALCVLVAVLYGG